jgi:seryl-tRNA synthetase
MHDIRAIRDNPDAFKAALARRSGDWSGLVEALLAHDGAARQAIADKQAAETARNTNSKLIGQAKAQKDEARAQALMAEVAEAKAIIEAAGEQEAAALKLRDDILAGLPNLPADDAPIGADEHANVELTRKGTPPDFAFAPIAHDDLGTALGQVDFEAAARMSGARFVVLKNQIARMHRALGQFMLDIQTNEHGYMEIDPPLLVRDPAMFGTGQLPKFGDDLFFGADQGSRAEQFEAALGEGFDTDYEARRAAGQASVSQAVLEHLAGLPTSEPHWLIPTAEVPLTNLVREQVLEDLSAPLRLTALTPCFRAEAGSAGRDTKGMIRQHQFWKVELVSIARPDQSEAEHERMTGCAEAVLQRLELPYRKMLLCTGDMGFGARKTYDLEVWLPSQNTYREISSCSNCGDFQARRMNARFRPEPGGKPEFVHTLNGSGLAVGRTLVAVMENYQNADGTITVPAALRPYMGGLERIG